MTRRWMPASLLLGLALGSGAAEPAPKKTPPKFYDPPHEGFPCPRPYRDAVGIPVNTSLFFLVEGEGLDPASVCVSLSDGGPAVTVLEKGVFAKGFSGVDRPEDLQGHPCLGVRIQPAEPLKPGTRYTVTISSPVQASWSFTTAPAEFDRTVPLALDLAKARAVDWDGQFWAGPMRVAFDATASAHQDEAHDLMRAVRERSRSPVFSLFRPWPLHADFYAPFYWGNPNLVRERETRRITKVADAEKETRLTVEDTFEHALYGVPDNRPLGGDYHPGDEVLIADKDASERAKVLAVDEAARVVTVSRLTRAAASWVLDPHDPVQSTSPDVPDRFTPPMGYLRKFSPCGTPAYYWGRLDHEFDRLVKRDGFRIVFDMTGTPTDLSVDGLPAGANRPKDWAEYWEFVRALARHTGERYGKAAEGFHYCVGNEFDLHGVFWCGTEEETFAFYDYTVDAMLKGLEEAGLDASKAPVGGMEWSLIFGNTSGVTRFAEHCSPRGKGSPNHAWADPHLKGKHARRVEALCSAHGGRGSPCDFLSIHAYASAAETARLFLEAKQRALAVDPDYFKDTRICYHESCPTWVFYGDEAQKTGCRDNGYFPAWCADVQQRVLEKAAQDPRYAGGENTLTIWPVEWNGAGLNDMVTVFKTTDGKFVTVPLPVFHFQDLMGRMSHRQVPLPAVDVQGARVSGFASVDSDGVRFMLYAIHPNDTECAGAWEYRVKLRLSGLQGKASRITEWRIDRDHASLRAGIQGVAGVGNPFAQVKPGDAARIAASSALKPSAPARRIEHPDGTTEIEIPVGENGVTLVEILKP